MSSHISVAVYLFPRFSSPSRFPPRRPRRLPNSSCHSILITNLENPALLVSYFPKLSLCSGRVRLSTFVPIFHSLFWYLSKKILFKRIILFYRYDTHTSYALFLYSLLFSMNDELRSNRKRVTDILLDPKEIYRQKKWWRT